MSTLRDALSDWTDIDVAQHVLAQSLSLMPAELPMRAFKEVYWTDNRLGNALVKILDQLVDLGVLEKRSEPDWQYRWSPSFEEGHADGRDTSRPD